MRSAPSSGSNHGTTAPSDGAASGVGPQLSAAVTLKPPAPLDHAPSAVRIFLGGSIEMGVAEDWQAALSSKLSDLPVVLLNPRRDEWHSEWKQEISNEPFRQQVEWELDGLVQCEVVAFYFAPGTKSPVTLLELGLLAHSGKVIVCCPEGFWRKGNVDIVCHRYGIPTVATLDELATSLRERITAVTEGSTAQG